MINLLTILLLLFMYGAGASEESPGNEGGSCHSSYNSWRSDAELGEAAGAADSDEEELDRSLLGLLNLAKQEMKEEEAVIRKVDKSYLTGCTSTSYFK